MSSIIVAVAKRRRGNRVNVGQRLSDGLGDVNLRSLRDAGSVSVLLEVYLIG